MIKNLIKLADHLDKKGFHKEADYVDWIIRNANSEITDRGLKKEGSELDKVINEFIAEEKRLREAVKKQFRIAVDGNSKLNAPFDSPHTYGGYGVWSVEDIYKRIEEMNYHNPGDQLNLLLFISHKLKARNAK